MADATQSQTDNAAQSQTDTKQGQSQADNQTQSGADTKTDDKAETFDRAYVEKLRTESAGYRTKLHTVEGELQKFKDSQLSEIDRAKREATDASAKATQLEAELKQSRVMADVALHSVGLKIVDADAAYKLMDVSAVEFDTDGKPKNVKTLLNHLIKEKTFLLGSTVTTKPNNPGRDGAGLTLDQIKKMTPAEIIANKEAVDAVLAANA